MTYLYFYATGVVKEAYLQESYFLKRVFIIKSSSVFQSWIIEKNHPVLVIQKVMLKLKTFVMSIEHNNWGSTNMLVQTALYHRLLEQVKINALLCKTKPATL